MIDADPRTDAARDGPKRGRARAPLLLSSALAAGLAIAAGAGCYWYWQPHSGPPEAAGRAPQPPFYLELKPFVISVASAAGTPHFVQLGLNLGLSGKDAGSVVGAVLPEVQDALRQTVLGFKAEDIVTPDGVDKLRAAMVTAVNRVLLQRLGAAEVKRLGAANANGGIVANLYFSTLIVE